MQWQKPIIDRTAQDVIFADNNRGLLTPNKGARNYTDFRRIYGNLEAIREYLRLLGHFTLPLIGNEEMWTMDFIPRNADIDVVRKDVEYIRQFVDAIGWLSAETPAVPNLPLTTYQKMNDIEQILLNIHEIFIKVKAAQFYLGEIYLGEV